MADNKEDVEKVPKKRGRKPKQDVAVNEEKENIRKKYGLEKLHVWTYLVD